MKIKKNDYLSQTFSVSDDDGNVIASIQMECVDEDIVKSAVKLHKWLEAALTEHYGEQWNERPESDQQRVASAAIDRIRDDET